MLTFTVNNQLVRCFPETFFGNGDLNVVIAAAEKWKDKFKGNISVVQDDVGASSNHVYVLVKKIR
jgi:hypothetical protein